MATSRRITPSQQMDHSITQSTTSTVHKHVKGGVGPAERKKALFAFVSKWTSSHVCHHLLSHRGLKNLCLEAKGMNIVVLSCRYERDEVFKHVTVSTCNIALLYFRVLLQPGECLQEFFMIFFRCCVNNICFLIFFFLFSREERKTNANLKKELQAHLEISWLGSVCALIKSSLQALLCFEQTGLFNRESEESEAPAKQTKHSRTMRSHISFHTCKLRNLLTSPTLG